MNRLLSQRPTVGVLETPLPAARSGVWDRAPSVRVRMIHGALESKEAAAVLAGGNVAIIGDGTPDTWEVIQFAQADLVGEDLYEISDRLRGQAGSDSLAFGEWPAGSWFVLLDGAATQLDLPASAMGQKRHYRVGPASRPVSDPVYVEAVHAFAGNGLRPYAPAHLRAVQDAGGDVEISWIRRTRTGGDSWIVPEVPLGEESEAYRMQIWSEGELRHEEILTEPGWSYSAAMQAAHSVGASFEVRVAQVSSSYGVGPDKSLLVAIS